MRRFPIFIAAVVGVALLMPGWPSAQTARIHLNPVIEKLAQGRPFVGVNTGDLSLENARTLARAPIDYVYVDMEHTPLNFEGLHMFLMKNLDEILSVPGIGAVFIGNANDLRHSIGVPATSPEVEAARQTILKGCLAHNVACGITVGSGADMVKRLNEGWKMIRATVEIIRNGRALQEKR